MKTGSKIYLVVTSIVVAVALAIQIMLIVAAGQVLALSEGLGKGLSIVIIAGLFLVVCPLCTVIPAIMSGILIKFHKIGILYLCLVVAALICVVITFLVTTKSNNSTAAINLVSMVLSTLK